MVHRFNTRRNIRDGIPGKLDVPISLSEALAIAEKKIRFMQCDEHWKTAAVRADGDSFSLSTCCEHFKRRVIEALTK